MDEHLASWEKCSNLNSSGKKKKEWVLFKSYLRTVSFTVVPPSATWDETHFLYLPACRPCKRRRHWRPTPVLLPGKSHGWRSLVGCSPWGRKESDTTEQLHFHFSLSCIGEGNGNPLQCSCLENPRDGGACWAAVYGVAQSWTRLKWLSSSSRPCKRSEIWRSNNLGNFSCIFFYTEWNAVCSLSTRHKTLCVLSPPRFSTLSSSTFSNEHSPATILNNLPFYLESLLPLPSHHHSSCLFKEFLLFFKTFWCGSFFVSTDFITRLSLLYVLVFWPQGMWDSSSPTRDQTCTRYIGRQSLNHRTTRKSLYS